MADYTVPSTSSLTQQQQQSASAANAAAAAAAQNGYDPSDYIEISQPDPIFLSQWSCVPIRCTLAVDDRKVLNTAQTGGSLASPLDRFQHGAGGGSSPFICEYIVPRQSYFFMHCETILESFKDVVAKEGFPWISYRVDEHTTAALPWQYPVGVVVDIMRMKRRTANGASVFGLGGGSASHHHHGFDDRVYPFEITFHLSEPKAATVNDPAYAAYLRSLRVRDLKGGLLFLRQVLKKSTVYAYGSTIPLLELEVSHPDYYTDLFEGIQENDPEKFWRGRCALRYYGEAEREDEAIEGSIVNVNVGLGVAAAAPNPSASAPAAPADAAGAVAGADSNAAVGGASAMVPAGSSVPPAGPVAGAAGHAAYVRQQLLAYPILLHCEGTSKLVRWRQNGQKLGQFLKEHVPWLEFLTREDIFHRHEPATFVLIQGVSPFLSSPMEDLYELLASTDLVLHIVVRPIFVTAPEPAPPKK